MTVFLHSVKVTVFCSQMLDVDSVFMFYTSGCGLPPSGLGVWEQVLQDAELARRLQEEEDMLPHREVCYIEWYTVTGGLLLDPSLPSDQDGLVFLYLQVCVRFGTSIT